ncbi:hypothetical protein E2A64_01200 [Pseudohoeflea suaedae]|uniref:DUF2244 domain-containing protein n=1 Tax=Pseudohoeflea suaedae TaxID=877384 RepID=A0A4R5PLG9_9HYPH|nr:hypothetical protein [Pseudohoeflea suaedae]TDH37786.1 hypothetical protein E2A64_01200 [Pseudohoeflea suaedae]
MKRILFAVLSIALAGFALASFAAVSVIAFAAIASLTLWASAKAMLQRSAPQPAYVRTESRTPHDQRITRVWNDGRGTIIDM